MCFLPLPQVVGEVLLDVLHKVVRVLRVEVQNLVQALQVDALQVTVGQRLDVGVGLNHSIVQGHVGPDQVALTCSERDSAHTPSLNTCGGYFTVFSHLLILKVHESFLISHFYKQQYYKNI